MTRRDAITLRGMRFHALVGILPHEREVPQPLEVDLTVWLGAAVMGREPAAPVVDYRELYDRVARVIGQGPLLHLEDVAAAIADAALDVHRVAEARVAVRKPHVALPGPLAYAEVVLHRTAR